MLDTQSLSDLIHRVLMTTIVVSLVVNVAMACILVRERQRAVKPLSAFKLFADRIVFILATVIFLMDLVVLGLSHHQIIQFLLLLIAGFFTAINFVLTLSVTIERRIHNP